MFASRFVRNIGAAGNRLMNEAGGPRDKNMLFYGAGGLALLTGLVYWAGYKAEGMSKAGRENLRELEARAKSL
ncbi:hypothetical protein M413DRAFT_440540, partial [Hebeloma cylindrosporum]